METTKLHSVIAVEKGVKSRVYSEITALHKEAQKSEPYNGFNKTWKKKDEDGEDFPAESKKVVLTSKEVLAKAQKGLSELFNIEATKDYGNCGASADVVVDGSVLVASAPATFLLFLEKQLTDLRTFVSSIPTLDLNEDWTLEHNSGLFRTQPSNTHRTKKVERAMVLYPATPEHPAQTKTVTEDVIIGWWETTKRSGAVPVPRKEELLERIEKVLKATKIAREEANGATIQEVKVADNIFGYLFA